MKKLDLYWKRNPDWWEFVDHVQVLKEDAPPEAKRSYENFLRQLREIEKDAEEN